MADKDPKIKSVPLAELKAFSVFNDNRETNNVPEEQIRYMIAFDDFITGLAEEQILIMSNLFFPPHLNTCSEEKLKDVFNSPEPACLRCAVLAMHLKHKKWTSDCNLTFRLGPIIKSDPPQNPEPIAMLGNVRRPLSSLRLNQHFIDTEVVPEDLSYYKSSLEDFLRELSAHQMSQLLDLFCPPHLDNCSDVTPQNAYSEDNASKNCLRCTMMVVHSGNVGWLAPRKIFLKLKPAPYAPKTKLLSLAPISNNQPASVQGEPCLGDSDCTEPGIPEKEPASPTPPPREEQFGGYDLIKRLGVGGMAEVWKARFTRAEGFEKTVVVKRILPHLTRNHEFVRMFIAEAKIVAKLSHSNIVQVSDFGLVDGQPFLVMEHIDGVDLREVYRYASDLSKPLHVSESVLIATAVAAGLAHAHGDLTGAPPVIHRDVSPHNILLSRSGNVKLTDFGIAKLESTDSASPSHYSPLGKVRYASPEQIRGENLDGRSDIYSLGVVLWELLSGHLLFEGLNDLVLLERSRPGTLPEPPSKFNPKVPPQIDQIVLRCLEHNPKKRFSKASDLEEALERTPIRIKFESTGGSDCTILSSLCHSVLISRDPGLTGSANIPAADEPKVPDVEKQPRVLVVDQPTLCRAFRRLLQPFEIFEATAAEDARWILERDRRFDVILCEVMQPSMSAQELHAWVASVDQALANRIVFTTTGDFSEPRCDFLRNLPNKRLAKPIADLKKYICEFLGDS